MNVQAILLGLIIPTLLASLYHLWKGGPFWNLIIYILSAEAGFWSAHAVATILGVSTGMVGSLQVLSGIIGGVVFLFLGRWLFITARTSEGDGKIQ